MTLIKYSFLLNDIKKVTISSQFDLSEPTKTFNTHINENNIEAFYSMLTMYGKVLK